MSSTSCASPSTPACRPGGPSTRSAAAGTACSRAELRAAAARIELGVPRATVLETLERRCPAEGIAPLTAALLRAERHGTPLGPALEALAADARARHAQRLRERAARAAPKIQLVVALLLVPAVMLLVGAALTEALA